MSLANLPHRRGVPDENSLPPRLDLSARRRQTDLSQRPGPHGLQSQAPDEERAVHTAQEEFDNDQPQVVVGVNGVLVPPERMGDARD